MDYRVIDAGSHLDEPDIRQERVPTALKDRAPKMITDLHGIESRHAIGIDRIMRSTGYPHAQTDWPHSMRTAAYELRHVPEDERRRIMCDNAAELYKLNGS